MALAIKHRARGVCVSSLRLGALTSESHLARNLFRRRHMERDCLAQPFHKFKTPTGERIDKTIEQFGVIHVMGLHRIIERRVNDFPLLLSIPPMCPVAELLVPVRPLGEEPQMNAQLIIALRQTGRRRQLVDEAGIVKFGRQ